MAVALFATVSSAKLPPHSARGKILRFFATILPLTLCAWFSRSAFAVDPPPSPILNFSITQGQAQLQWSPYPAAQQYHILGANGFTGPFSLDLTGLLTGNVWTAPLASPMQSYRLQVVPLSADVLLATTALNRLAYGPTPDELQRVLSMGPQAYIQEQLAPELISEQLSIDTTHSAADWQYVTATGTGSSSVLYMYLTLPGEGYVDDLKLVSGEVAEQGTNLLRNADFEAPLSPNDWVVSPNLAGSAITTQVNHSGTACLHLVAASGGSTQSSAIWQTTKPALSASKTYTLSYWYLPSTTQRSPLSVRLSGSGIVTAPDSLLTKLDSGLATINDLRAWFMLRAVTSQRQLLEILVQFFENHFVTQYTKSQSYFATFYKDSGLEGRLATQLSFKQDMRWRQALLNPSCTFLDLLRISAESPAMIIYLDTVNSKGNAKNIANENYARELQELFTFGVDNGYDQNDIVAMSKAWTGWSLNLVAPTDEFNPLAPQTTLLKPGVTNNFTAITNLVGVWAFNFKTANHNTNSKTIFPGKTVPARFGPPYAGRNYELRLPARTGEAGLQDGYDVITHLADQPFTQEFISVKLCQVFVHDNFAIGYDFTDPNLSPEGQLVRTCMTAWENSQPKGQIRAVLSAIFNSDMFRGHAASMQKVKTPLEYSVSAIRALRGSKSNGTYTADTDGYSLVTPLSRMGSMNLFDRMDPNGYAEVGPAWISAGTLAERVRFVQTLCLASSDPSKNDGLSGGNKNVSDPVSLLQLKLPATALTDAGAVADYFLANFFAAEGKANLDLYRTLAVNFLNTADDGTTPSLFASLKPGTSTYDTRIRGLAAMLLTSPRFNEQ
jgi:uncharacterized protein (DUF1800 family)